jgi:hypothetical protein
MTGQYYTDMPTVTVVLVTLTKVYRPPRQISVLKALPKLSMQGGLGTAWLRPSTVFR